MRLHPLPCSLSRAGLLTEPTPAARRNVFMDPDHVEDMLAHAAASFSLQLQKQDRVSISANAMREMLDELMTGDVSVIDDTPVMRMPDGFMTREYGEWVAIVPALEGWVDCMQRITPGLSSGAIVDLGNLLRAGEEITPELVMVVRIQLEDQIQAMKRMPIGAINAAVESTKSDWRKEEKLKEETEMNARDKAPTLPAIDGTINAAHGLLMAATDALSADQVAAMLKTTKKAATAQLKELQGLGFLESELRKGGTRYFRLVVVTEAKPGIPVVADDGCGACGDACASNDGNCRVKEESPPVLLDVQAEKADDEMPPADPALLASANRMLSDRLEGVAHALRGCGLPALAEISGAEDLQMATAALSGAYQMSRDELAAANRGAISLLDVITDIRAVFGSAGERIQPTDIANYITDRMLERDVNTRTVVDALVAVAGYLPDGYNYRLIDGIRTMELLIEAHWGYISAQEGRIVSLSAIANSADSRINSLVSDVTNTRRVLNDALNEVDRMRTELAIERQARQALQEQINAAPAPAPKGYVLKTPKRAMRSFGKEAAAQSAAMVAARAGKTGEVFALVPVGKAVRGAEWRGA